MSISTLEKPTTANSQQLPDNTTIVHTDENGHVVPEEQNTVPPMRADVAEIREMLAGLDNTTPEFYMAKAKLLKERAAQYLADGKEAEADHLEKMAIGAETQAATLQNDDAPKTYLDIPI